MKTSKLWLIGMALCLSLPVSAEMRTIAEAYEVALSDFHMPASENGILSFKQCSTCKVQVVKVTGRTEYILNQESMELADFRKSLSKVRQRSAITVIVRHHLESNTIDRVSVTL